MPATLSGIQQNQLGVIELEGIEFLLLEGIEGIEFLLLEGIESLELEVIEVIE